MVLPPLDVEFGQSALEMEWQRQELARVARDEFGLRVLDASLGEKAPDKLPPDRHIRFGHPEGSKDPTRYAVSVGPDLGQTIWEDNTPMLKSIPSRFTARLFRECLVAARFKPKPTKRSTAPVPPGVEELLGQMRETSQFAAVRLLHAEIRASGESEALVGALARGYANLGLLTEYQWGAAPTAFQARGLVYAIRLRVLNPKSPVGLWHCMYAHALAGFHVRALVDQAAAAKRMTDAAPPAWLKPIAAYIRFDADGLAEMRKTDDSPLVRLLQFLVAEEPRVPLATLKAAEDILKAEPECYRVHDTVCRVGGVGNLRAATTAWLETYGRAMPGRLKEMPGLPKAARDAVEAGSGGEGGVYTALRAAGDAATDRGEPTWGALARVTQNGRFVQAWNRLYFLHHVLGVPTEEDAACWRRPSPDMGSCL